MEKEDGGSGGAVNCIVSKFDRLGSGSGHHNLNLDTFKFTPL